MPTLAAQLAAFREGLNTHESTVLGAEREAARALLAARAGAAGVLDAADHALAAAEGLARALVVLQPGEAIACREGCLHCCYLKVSATPPEIFALADYLRRSWPPDALVALRARTAALAADPRLLSADEKARARLPCPLLTAAGTCGAYEARPLACRGWTSTDAAACERGLDDDSEPPLTNEKLSRETAALGIGLLDALADTGLRSEVVELTSALHIALSEPHAFERWLRGEAVFSAATSEH